MNRYIHTFAIMLAALLAAGTVKAQTPTGGTGPTIRGNVFGGGNNAGVQTNTVVNISAGQVEGNVYGGGNVGDVGTIDKNTTDYNYTWKQSDGTTDNVAEHNKNATAANTGICTVRITGGTIGVDNPADAANQGNVFGAGRGLDDTWWCEKAIVYATSVTISKTGTTGTVVKGNVYGGGQVGRVEDDAKVVIGTANGEDEPDIRGSVFGAGAGLQTHGYSALVRGNAAVTVQGKAKIGGSVYGGGETASVGRFTVVDGLPKHPDSGGYCTVTIQDNAQIGTSGTGHNVYGACKGVTPSYVAEGENRSKSMQLRKNAPSDDNLWSSYNNDENSPFIWRYYASEEDYKAFLRTLALTSHPTVTIAENATVYGSVYGGGERGMALGNVDVNITGGTVEQDVYGGGALADTNAANVNSDVYAVASVTAGETVVTGMYTRSGAGTDTDPYVYTVITTADAKAEAGTTYYTTVVPSTVNTTSVDLTGGLIKGDAYGGGLGQRNGFNDATSDIAATVFGDIEVTLNGTAFYIDHYEDEGHTDIVKSGRVFGCNNLLGSPQGNVTVKVYKTVYGNTHRTTEDPDNTGYATKNNGQHQNYEVAAVYGGGNLANYTTAGKKAKVIIETCDVSIESVYGGGNAAEVPETDVLVKGAYEIGTVFGGGNGNDPYTTGTNWVENPGANVNGNANTLLTGGYIHEAYGGSNKRGTITGNVTIDVGTDGACTLDVGKVVAAGKNADVEGNLIVIMGCKPSEKVPVLFAGADDANVYGNVELTITSGNFGKVFGGNNNGGCIYGHIKLNIEETGDCDTPITIDTLYLGGNQAAYSVYGYKTEEGKLVPQSADELKAAIAADPGNAGKTDEQLTALFNSTKQEDPELNIVSCTYIGQVFGGGYGTGAYMYADPKVNINMIQGSKHSGVPNFMTTDSRLTALNLNPDDNPKELGVIGTVYGGGNAADVYGNPTVNIGTASTVKLHESLQADGVTYNMSADQNVLGAYIAGNVFGGGKGVADVYRCPKGMIGIDGDGVDHPDGGTMVNIFNGFINGSVYGGGEVGRVEKNTVVNIGTGEGTADATSKPVIKGNVFGAGKGESTHGYAALVRGNATVSVMGNAKVMQSVYGGGEIASVGRYKVAEDTTEATEHDVEVGEPYSLANPNSGNCIVTVGGYAEIGPDNMQMKNTVGGPDDTGYVFGAGKGVLPYEGYADSETPWRKTLGTSMTDDTDDGTENYGAANEDAYLKYIGTLALATKTDVTIKDYAFIKGSVYGGSENGRVQHDTDVKIQGYCQIGNGWDKTKNNGAGGGVNARYDETHFINPAEETADVIEGKATILHECAHWDYGVEENGKMVYHPYDKYEAREGASTTATDGHTFFGNVFGGGSGLYPYKSRKENVGYEWLRTAGQVSGNTNVTITGGHILTSVYGGCELTDVGNSETLKEGKGKCTVKMSGGTLGVPRTLAQIAAHPVTCYLFGAGKGDQREHFNQWTNVGSVEVEVSGSAIIYGSVFGGGEDGHVLGDAKVTIKENAVIGTWGTSYVDGNIFGAGRGFGGDALTAGVISGNVTVNIEGGTMLGSVYGGGRLASVGTHLVPSDNTNYGKLIPNGKKQDIGKTELENDANATHGYVTINISGGTIGNNLEYIYPTNENMTAGEWTTWKTSNYIPQTEFGTSTAGREDVNRLLHTRGGNVFAGAMGRLYALDGSTVLTYWADMGKARKTTVNISGGHIKSNVYGGGELGTLVEGSEITITGGTIGTEVKDAGGNVKYLFGSVFGGGYGSAVDGVSGNSIEEEGKTVTAKDHAGHVLGNTKIEMKATTGDSPTTGTVLGSIYGGGELAWVNGNTDISVSAGTIGRSDVQGSSDPKPYYVKFGGYRMGNIFGGGKGSTDYHLAGIIKGNATVSVSGGNIYHNIYGGGALGSVGTFTYDNTTNFPTACTNGTGTATVTVTGGTIGVNGWDNGIISGSSRGDIQDEKPAEGSYDMHDKLAWVNNSVVTIGTKDATTGPEVRCTVYGGGENGHNLGNTTVTVHSGTIGYSNDVAWECGNVFGAGCGTDVYDHAANEPFYHNPMGGLVKGTTDVTVDGGHVLRSVYGGGSMGSVEGKSTVSVEGGRIGHNVFGGPEGDNEASGDPAHVAETEVNIQYATTPAADNADHTEKLIAGSVYGGGEAGLVYGTVAVNMKGGLVINDVYGGGALAHTNTSNWSGTTWAAGKTSASSTTTVSLTGGTIAHNVYGGGLGQLAKEAVAAQGTVGQEGYVPAQPAVAAIEAKVYGDVQVDLNKPTTTTTGEGEGATTTTTYGDCEVKGNIFGCNNLNGSPQGGVTVHVYKTVAKENGTEKAKPAKDTNTYELTAVYGGGNLAAFYPDDANTRATAKANVIIDGCDLTSIQTVYGGGNAASVPETDVVINGTYEVKRAFGGGNGEDNVSYDGGVTYVSNPGANVGYLPYSSDDEKTAAIYGTGKAHVTINGGTVHEVYGGSNTKGNVRKESCATVIDEGICAFNVEDAYGGGRNALQDGDAVLDIDCISGLGKAYGGASNADVNGDIILNITNGTYGQVFGGNDQGGCIRGSITVNVDETGCRPVIIGELYGGGNKAAYSVYGYNDDGTLKTSGTAVTSPTVNVRSFTSIGRIFGGGYGEEATMVGNPTVNINVVGGKYWNDDRTNIAEGARVVGSRVVDNTAAGYDKGFPIPSHGKNKIGAIQDVFGGGNAAQVIGNPTVNIGTEAGEEDYVEVLVKSDESVADLYTRSGAGTTEDPYNYVKASDPAVAGTTYYLKTVKAVDIRGNVYGGGNNAEVTGNTNVVIGKRNE